VPRRAVLTAFERKNKPLKGLHR